MSDEEQVIEFLPLRSGEDLRSWDVTVREYERQISAAFLLPASLVARQRVRVTPMRELMAAFYSGLLERLAIPCDTDPQERPSEVIASEGEQ